MSGRSRHPGALMVMFFLAVILPLQGMALVALGMRGPAHFHIESTEVETAHAHSHADTEHHHHHVDEEGVMFVDEEDEPHHLEAMEEGVSRQGSGGASDALPSMMRSARLRPIAEDLNSGDASKPPHAFVGRLERPPDALRRSGIDIG